MQFEIITPLESLYSGEVELVQLPGTKGLFEILKNHAPIVSSLEEGKVKIVDKNDKTIFFAISGGVVECKSNKIVLLANDGKEVHN